MGYGLYMGRILYLLTTSVFGKVPGYPSYEVNVAQRHITEWPELNDAALNLNVLNSVIRNNKNR